MGSAGPLAPSGCPPSCGPDIPLQACPLPTPTLHPPCPPCLEPGVCTALVGHAACLPTDLTEDWSLFTGRVESQEGVRAAVSGARCYWCGPAEAWHARPSCSRMHSTSNTPVCTHSSPHITHAHQCAPATHGAYVLFLPSFLLLVVCSRVLSILVHRQQTDCLESCLEEHCLIAVIFLGSCILVDLEYV